MKKTLAFALVGVLSVTSLTACGFQLRGYHDTPRVQAIRNLPATALVFGNEPQDFAVKNALRHQFEQLTLPTVDLSPSPGTGTAVNVSTDSNRIEVSNIQLQTYRLRGLLTEIRMVMSADVSYQVYRHGTPTTVKNTVQVQRSYQYDQATVATDNPQAEQIKVWLYDNLAQRIVDQYVALAIPAVPNS